MIDLTIRTQMDKRAVFRAEMQMQYRTMAHAAIVNGILFAAFAVDFGVDWAINGTSNAWGVTKSLFWLTIVVTAVVAVYCAVSPLLALLAAKSRVKKDASLTRERVLKFDKKGLTFPEGEGGKDTIGWAELRLRRTKEFVVFRTAAGSHGPQVVLPLADATAEQIAEIEETKKAFDHREFLKKNPVSAERERKAGEIAQAGASDTAADAAADEERASDAETPSIPDEDLFNGTDG